MKDGIPADLTRVVDISKVRGSHANVIADVMSPLADGLREQGYTWFRVTAPADDEDHVYMEAWVERPMKDGCLQEGELDRSAAEFIAPGESRNVSCPKCGKRVRRVGLDQHVQAAHGSSNTSTENAP